VNCILVGFWPTVGTMCTDVEMLYKVSCPVSEESTCRNRLCVLRVGCMEEATNEKYNMQSEK